jgi:hypothetical protein
MVVSHAMVSSWITDQSGCWKKRSKRLEPNAEQRQPARERQALPSSDITKSSLKQKQQRKKSNNSKWARSDQDQTQWRPPQPSNRLFCPCSRPSAPNWTNTTIAVNAPSKPREISLLRQRRCPFLELLLLSYATELWLTQGDK